jgi:hypothetical protein
MNFRMCLLVLTTTLSLSISMGSGIREETPANLQGRAPRILAPLPFYSIAHSTNSIGSVDWAVSKGANGIEMDLRFDTRTLQPTVFQYSIGCQPCDCTCYLFIPTPAESVCKRDGGNVSSKTSQSSDSLLAHAATKELALVVIDSKTDETSIPQDDEKFGDAGKAVVELLLDNLFAHGFEGDVVVGVPYLAQYAFLESAASAAMESIFQDRFYFTIDGEGKNVAGVIDKLIELPSNNLVYGTGNTACWPFSHYNDAIRTGASNQNDGGWTLDRAESMDAYIESGAGGVMINYPQEAVEAAARNGMALAKPGVRGQIPTATSSTMGGTPSHTCDYDYSKTGGCKITTAAPAGWACQCKYKGLWRCGGSIATCADTANTKCDAPDTTFEACLQGDGNCHGYSDYSIRAGGCIISKAAPSHSACKCQYNGY